jgi:methylated-DNA-protein-cysteine methyltransferase-like protein
MKDYPDRMTAEQARVFGEDVLNIVSQIPHGKVTTYGHIKTRVNNDLKQE